MEVYFGHKIAFSLSFLWRKLDSMPDDPPGSQVFGMGIENCEGFLIAYPVGIKDTMPFNDPQAVIDGIHNALADDQALIEVKSGYARGRNHIYSIVKTKKQPSGVQYVLTMDVAGSDGAFHVQGFFDEVGITGQRDAMIYEMKRKDGSVGNDFTGWMADPYDANCQKEYLMNLSELEEYDSMFPSHPLTIAREIARKLPK